MCIFCSIIARELPAEVLYEDDSTLAFMDINPWTKGHCLVISKEHAETFFDLSEESAAAIMKTAWRIAPAVRNAVKAEGMNLLQSNGKAAWQQVDHFHLHLIPRWSGDALRPPISPQPGDPSEISAAANQIRESI